MRTTKGTEGNPLFTKLIRKPFGVRKSDECSGLGTDRVLFCTENENALEWRSQYELNAPKVLP